MAKTLEQLEAEKIALDEKGKDLIGKMLDAQARGDYAAAESFYFQSVQVMEEANRNTMEAFGSLGSITLEFEDGTTTKVSVPKRRKKK